MILPLDLRLRQSGSGELHWAHVCSPDNGWKVQKGDTLDRQVPACGCGSPGEANASTCYCGVDDLLRIIRRRYSLAVMNAINTHATPRYHEIASGVPGVSSSTLAETLRALEAAQLISRHPGDDSAFPTYSLTESGAKLLSRLRQLLTEL